MNRIGRAGRDQPYINDCPCRPGVAFIDRIAVGIDLQRAVEVRAFFNRATTVVFDHATPEDGLALVVSTLQFKPGVVGIDGAAREEVADFFRSDHNVNSHRVSTTQGWLNTIERSADRSGLAFGAGRDFAFRFFSNCKCCGQL